MTRYILVTNDLDDYLNDDCINSQEGLFVPENRYYDIQSKRIEEAADIIKSCADLTAFYKETHNNRLKKVVEILNN